MTVYCINIILNIFSEETIFRSFLVKNIPVPNRVFSENSMKTDGKSTREKDHLGSDQLKTNPKHTVAAAGDNFYYFETENVIF